MVQKHAWTMRKADIKGLEAFETWTWSRMLKVSCTDHKTNEEVYRKRLEKKDPSDAQ